MEYGVFPKAAAQSAAEIRRLLREKERVLVAIDGRCAAGKSTLAESLRELCDCSVIHMDHFFPQPEQRTAERLNTPGGNVDHERFLQEVLLPLTRGEAVSYRPYDCKIQALTGAIQVASKPVTVVEGSYSCHPSLREYYDLTVFLTVDEAEQLRRIERRNGAEAAILFRERWIPLEERYFSAYSVAERCDLRFQTDGSGEGRTDADGPAFAGFPAGKKLD